MIAKTESNDRQQKHDSNYKMTRIDRTKSSLTIKGEKRATKELNDTTLSKEVTDSNDNDLKKTS